MKNTHEQGFVSPKETVTSQHIASIESMEEQAELQRRLALVAYQFLHPDMAQAIRPCAPETNDTEIQNAAMLYWGENYAKGFRETWLPSVNVSKQINMDDIETLQKITFEIMADGFVPPTLH